MARYTGMFRLYPVPNASEDGFIDTDKNIIKKSILNILKTVKGSRVYDPDYGTLLHQLIHEQNIGRTRNIARMEVENAISKYEPRAEIMSVEAFPGEGEKEHELVIMVSVKYIEYGEVEDLEIRMARDEEWMTAEGTGPANPIADWFNN